MVETKCTVVQREQCFPYPDWQCEEVQQPAQQCRQLPEEVCQDTVRTVTKYVETEECEDVSSPSSPSSPSVTPSV